jgi:VWFA-related protein
MRGLALALAFTVVASAHETRVTRAVARRAQWDGPTTAALQSGRGAGANAPAQRAIRLDVIVTDGRGHTVDNLSAADFELREDDAVQSIDGVRFVRAEKTSADYAPVEIDSDASERTEAVNANTRLVGMFLDEYHVSADGSARVRAAVNRFVEQSLSAQDLIVVMRPLDSLFAIRMTRDRDRIREAVDSFEGRRGDYTPRNSYERNYMAGTAARIEQLRAQVATSALNALANHLGSLNGDARKTLIVVSEGLPRVDRRRGLESLPTLDTVTRSANRHNVSIYPVDPREPAPDAAAPAELDALRTLAVSTDGQTIVNVADLGEAMRPIVSDASAYYILLYHATQKADGKFHDVQVTVKKRGVTVRTRKGYWAPTPDEALRAALQPRAPIVLEPARHISPFIKPWFGASRGADGKTRVTFVWEPANTVPGVRKPTAARVVLKALAADGSALFEGPVTPTGPLRPDASEETRARAVFEVPPGELRLRMTIENEAEQAIDSDVRDITVRDLSGPVVLGTPAVFRGRTARDFRALESAPEATPVASREFSRSERLLIRVPAYAPPGAPLTVAARLLNRKGQLMRDLVIRPGATSSAPAEIDMPLAGFAVGEYRIEIDAKSPAAQVKDILEFRVTN